MKRIGEAMERIGFVYNDKQRIKGCCLFLNGQIMNEFKIRENVCSCVNTY